MALTNKNSERHRRIKDYILTNPHSIHDSYSKTAKTLNVDYRSVKHVLDNLSDDERQEIHTEIHGKLDKPESYSSTFTSNYISSKVPDHMIMTFEEYCSKFHIPIHQVTSSKFVNHQGQAAWNVVIDHTKISEKYLNEYFDKLHESLRDVITPKQLPIDYIDTDNSVAYCIWASDKHVGASNSENALFGNKYDSNVFRTRMFSVLKDYIEEASSRGGRFDKVFIGDLGDALDGWDASTTRKSSTHKLRQNLSNRESFDVYVRIMCEFIEALVELDLSNSYEFVAVTNDNHSSDFGYICNRAVEIYLNMRFPDIKTTIIEKFVDTIDYGMHTFMLTHGKDDEYMKHGMPLDLDPKTEEFINSLIDEHKIPHTQKIHVIKGDLHQAGLNYGRRFTYRNVMSMYGSSDYTQTVYGPNPAGISIDIVHKYKNKVSRYDIECPKT